MKLDFYTEGGGGSCCASHALLTILYCLRRLGVTCIHSLEYPAMNRLNNQEDKPQHLNV